MKLGERIKNRRKELGISVDYVAKELGVSVSTVYRYEDSSIEKIPVNVFEKLCSILQTTPARLMGNEEKTGISLPENFSTAQEAMEFILKMPTLAAYGGYDLEKLDEKKLDEFANEILQQLRLVSYKYK